MRNDRLIMLDIETTGLEANVDLILEVGILVVDVATMSADEQFSVLVWSEQHERYYEHLRHRADAMGEAGPKFVLDMHTSSGLWTEAKQKGLPLIEATSKLLSFLDGIEIEKDEPMVGSSIGFDRSFLKFWMPAVDSKFSYRNIDISSLKELCRRINPSVFAHLDKETNPAKAHRSVQDCYDSLGELEFYVDNFLFLDAEVLTGDV